MNFFILKHSAPTVQKSIFHSKIAIKKDFTKAPNSGLLQPSEKCHYPSSPTFGQYCEWIRRIISVFAVLPSLKG